MTKFWPTQYEKFGNDIYCFYVWSLRMHPYISLSLSFLNLFARCNGYIQGFQDLGIVEPVHERA